MSVDQTIHVIDRAREFHEQVGEYYHRMSDAAQRTRVRLLLDYMSQHEQRVADALAAYEDSAPEKILNTWLQAGDETDALQAVREQLRELRVDPSIGIDDLIELGLKLSECLLAVFRDLAARAEPASVRYAFDNLLRMEEKAQQQFARDAMRLSDL